MAEAGRAHLDLVRAADVGWFAAAMAMCRMYLFRLLLRATGLKLTKLPAPGPL